MRDQQVAEECPLPFWDYIGQIELQLYRIAVLGQLQPAREPDHVRVAGDRRDPEGIAQHDIRGLSAHTRQGHEFLHRAWDLAAEVLDDLAGGSFDVESFVVVKAAGPDVLLDLPEVRVGPVGGGSVLLEQVLGDQIDPDVGALGRQDRRDQQLQRIGEMQGRGGIRIGLFQNRQYLLVQRQLV